MSIKQLPSDVVAQIKSSIAITSLNTVVIGLLKNSLDAGSSQINISVDYRRGNCSVEDNGLGIAPAEFRDAGGLGKLHYTSKYPPDIHCYGRSGTFLASVAALSLLSITSHHHEHRTHNSLSIHNSKILARNTPALPEQRFLVFPYGTRVIVRDLFGTMPVRVKQRAVEMEKAGSAKELDQLILSVVGLLLVWPDKAAVTIRDVTSSHVVSLRNKDNNSSEDIGGTKDTFLLSVRTPKLLSQASLHDEFAPGSWIEVGARGYGICVRGCVCLVPTATKRLQFIAIGIDPLQNHHSANVLYEEVNIVFANSAFGVIEGDSDADAAGGKGQRTSFRVRDLKARKGIDRWPIFALQIQYEDRDSNETPGAEDILEGGSSDLTIITNLLRALAYQFLKKHHFRPKPINTVLHQPLGNKHQGQKSSVASVQHNSRTASPLAEDGFKLRTKSSRISGRSTPASARSTPIPESPFDGWSRVKVSRPLSAASISRPVSQRAQSPRRPLLDSNGKLLRKPFDDITPARLEPKLVPEAHTPSSHPLATEGVMQPDTVDWINPVTKNKSTIDTRTGFVLKTDSILGKRISLRPSADERGIIRPEPVPWIQEMLSEWQNPAYAAREAPIPKIPDLVETATRQGGMSTQCGHLQLDLSEASMLQFSGRVSKRALREAEVVSQVDSKFILAKLSLQTMRSTLADEARHEISTASELLLLVDQHAADERCRVEELQQQYFRPDSDNHEADTEQLEKQIRFELSKQEGQLVARFREHFAYWGVIYDVTLPEGSAALAHRQSKANVQVRSLPPSILERCRLEPRLLIDLIRKEVWKLADEHQVAVSSGSRHVYGGNDWVRRFHGCPQGILDLINSRACRSSIMFNDQLSKEQCQDLFLRLADCVFPFQCAHGRPSMVPIVDLGSWDAFGSSL